MHPISKVGTRSKESEKETFSETTGWELQLPKHQEDMNSLKEKDKRRSTNSMKHKEDNKEP